MGVFFFYKNRKPRKFNYKPILYDPDEDARKEKLQKRIESVKREMGVMPERTEVDKKDFKSEFVSQTRYLKKRKDREEAGGNSFITNNGLLIIIAVILLLIFIFWLLR
ncbi:MAG: hypothetical protein PHQ67_03890 [Fermentimonas sp.]|jgi:hypothetical protein|nr:hypothetical protein [Fermentimonas sp.]MDD4008938.1 hypothetical protein [Fermentimonas sp.]MDD4696893.1 hypothetical protein [Fermentimonas sp.]